MGCIEMRPAKEKTVRFDRINRNMGCIEIKEKRTYKIMQGRLIETWDVLKSAKEEPDRAAAYRLIETWDVLKFSLCPHCFVNNLINRNMGCIEIADWQGKVYRIRD